MHPFNLVGIKRTLFILYVDIPNTNTFTKAQVLGVTKFFTNFITGIIQRNDAVINLVLTIIVDTQRQQR